MLSLFPFCLRLFGPLDKRPLSLPHFERCSPLPRLINLLLSSWREVLIDYLNEMFRLSATYLPDNGH